jgi:predicted RNase H-like nuclease
MMRVVLGIDAAWTATKPSGIALVASRADDWRCVAIAPSYEAFLALASGVPVDWSQRRFEGSIPRIADLLNAGRTLAAAPVNVVAIDMPIARVPIIGRRVADRAVSREFGARGCSTHSPSIERPGPIGSRLSEEFAISGFPIATTATACGLSQHLVEVYPHPALLELLRRPHRVPYKVGKASRYWPRAAPEDRIALLLTEFRAIHQGLERVLGPTGLSLPAAHDVRSRHCLKRYEDVLDALVCAWVGVRFLQNAAIPLGDETAAIWCPKSLAAQV